MKYFFWNLGLATRSRKLPDEERTYTYRFQGPVESLKMCLATFNIAGVLSGTLSKRQFKIQSILYFPVFSFTIIFVKQKFYVYSLLFYQYWNLK